MGCTDGDCNEDGREVPMHQVTLSSYKIAKYPVTQQQWEVVMGNNPSNFKGSNLPIEMVSWYDIQVFITELNTLTGKNYRLPTEAEWEYAARGGNKSKGYKYSGSNDINAVAWYNSNSENTTHPVGTKAPNELEIYDMSGNLMEWCSDWFGVYTETAQTNPTGPATGYDRIVRGGDFYQSAYYCRVSMRRYTLPVNKGGNIGFRLVLP
jgi:formylglycine-generating enzyme required for sulfatase activity